MLKRQIKKVRGKVDHIPMCAAGKTIKVVVCHIQAGTVSYTHLALSFRARLSPRRSRVFHGLHTLAAVSYTHLDVYKRQV